MVTMKHSLPILYILLMACSVAVAGRRVEMGGMDYAYAVRDGAKAAVTLKIVDDVGNVVTGANVQVSFMFRGGKWLKGISDDKGLYSVQGRCSGEFIYDAKKAGYYPTDGDYSYPGEGNIRLAAGTLQPLKWLPYNPTNTVILKRIKNPVPMYVRRVDIKIPVIGTQVAYDIEKDDWVAPYGKGLKSDIIVTYEAKWIDPWTGSKKITLMFGTNGFDGVQCRKADYFSSLLSEYLAPLDGYQRSISWAFERTTESKSGEFESPKGDYYIFRVRTETDSQGRITYANYGKIYGPIQYGNGCANMQFLCYFNPEVNGRNLEFDPRHDLAGQRYHLP